MPVGVLAANGIAEAANGVSKTDLESAGDSLLNRVTAETPAPEGFAFPHVSITESAFPESTEIAIAKARQFIAGIEDEGIGKLLNLACMAVLEQVSYTRKDGQYLRWDYRSGRTLKARVPQGSYPVLRGSPGLPALRNGPGYRSPQTRVWPRLSGVHDWLMSRAHARFTGIQIRPDNNLPPYANRYDYTRTYALELAWLGYDQEEFADLRQRMLSATVENKAKTEWLRSHLR